MALSRLRRPVLWSVLLGGLLALSPARAEELKLYLKDGSYQLVKTYEVDGDRVRYYSLERSQWEEIPAALVDFDATKRGQQEEEARQEKQLEQAKALEKERFERKAPAGYEVAPGIHLPNVEGVYAFDGMRVIPIVQSSGEIVTDKERLALNLALPAPLLKKRALVVLPGAQAAVRISNAQPTLFVQSADGWGARAELIPLKAGKQSRVVEKIQSGVGVGKSGEVRDAIPLERAEVAPGLFKLRPTQPLPPGEYALAELIQEKLNLEVWDFGIEGAPKASRPAGPTGPAPMSERPPGDTKQPTPPPPSVPPPRSVPLPQLSPQPPQLSAEPQPPQC